MIFYNENNILSPFKTWDEADNVKPIRSKHFSRPMIGDKNVTEGSYIGISPNIVLNYHGREEYISSREMVIMTVIDNEL